jgi:hypothetical protein
MTLSSNPLLIVGYNRADLIIELVEQVHEFDRPIFIWLDGAKSESDSLAIETQMLLTRRLEELESKNIILKINSFNYGCGKSLPSAVDWVFEKYDRVIVLEDDIRVSSEFFSYMDWALHHFELSKNIYHINGWSPLGGASDKTVRIYQSRQVFGWGWATWRDRWARNDLKLQSYKIDSRIRSLPTLRDYSLNVTFERHWRAKLARCLNGLDAWDYQWQYSIWKNGGHAISPTHSFTHNIGFDNRATHTKLKPAIMNDIDFDGIFSPEKVEQIKDEQDVSALEYRIDLISYGLESKYSIVYFLKRFIKILLTFPKYFDKH